jgi:hypothetical protein
MPHLPALAVPLWLVLATAAVAQGSAPSWQTLAAPLDRARIDRAWATFDALLPRVRAALDAALASEPRPFEAAELVGDWRCRTIKLGGIGGGITAYGWFACRVTADGPALRLDKLTGSQRLTGTIHPDAPDRMILLGALHYHYEGPQPYAGPGTPDPDLRNMGGIVTMRGPDAVILFPEPHYESEADLLHMVRP